jgi:hypothetical protein
MGVTVFGLVLLMIADAAAVEAQGRGRGRHGGFHVPPGHMPAPGECRVWYHGRPPGHQPPPVPCAALRHYRFPGAVVIGAPLHRGGYGYWEDVRGRPRFRLVAAWQSEPVVRHRPALTSGLWLELRIP